MATDLRQAKSAAPAKYDTFVEGQLARAEKRIRMLDLATAGLGFLAGTFAYAAAVAILDRQADLSASARQWALVVYLLGSAAYVAFTVVRPLCRRINPYYAALQVEHTLPGAKNSVINWLDLHEQRLAPAIHGALGQRAAKDLARADLERAISGRRAGWMGGVAGVLAGVFVALFLLFGPAQFLSLLKRAFVPFEQTTIPSKTQIALVRPDGPDAQVFQGRAVTIEVAVNGKVPDPKKPDALKLHWRYDQNGPYTERLLGQQEDSRLWNTILSAADVRDGFFYKISGGDCVTEEFHVTVRSTPHIEDFKATYHFRPYVGRANEVRHDRKLEALRGTEVELRIKTNRTVQTGQMLLENKDGRKTISMARVPDDPSSLQLRFVLDDNGLYRLSFQTRDDETYTDATFHPITAILDKPPHEVVLSLPATNTKLPADSLLRVEGKASDDIGVKSLNLRMMVGAQKLKAQLYRPDEGMRLPKGGYPLSVDYKDFVELAKVHTDEDKPFALQPGMKLDYWLEATDGCDFHQPGVTESKHYQVEIVQPEKDARKQQQERDKAQKEKQEHEAKQEEQRKKEAEKRQQEEEQRKREADQANNPKNEPGNGEQQNPDKKNEEKGSKDEGTNQGQDDKGNKGNQPGEKQDPEQKKQDDDTRQKADDAKKEIDKAEGEKKDKQQGQQGEGKDNKGDAKGEQSRPGENKDAGKEQGNNKPEAGNKPDGTDKGEAKKEGSEGGKKDAGQNKDAGKDKTGAKGPGEGKDGGNPEPMEGNKGEGKQQGNPMNQAGQKPGEGKDEGKNQPKKDNAAQQPQAGQGKGGDKKEGEKQAGQEKAAGNNGEKGDKAEAKPAGADGKPADQRAAAEKKGMPKGEPQGEAKEGGKKGEPGQQEAQAQAKGNPEQGTGKPQDQGTNKPAPEKGEGNQVAKGEPKGDNKGGSSGQGKEPNPENAKMEDVQRLAKDLKQAEPEKRQRAQDQLERLQEEARDPKVREEAERALEEAGLKQEPERLASNKPKEPPPPQGQNPMPPNQNNGPPCAQCKNGSPGGQNQSAGEGKGSEGDKEGQSKGEAKKRGQGGQPGQNPGEGTNPGGNQQGNDPKGQQPDPNAQAKGKNHKETPGKGDKDPTVRGNPESSHNQEVPPNPQPADPLSKKATVTQLEDFKKKLDKGMLEKLGWTEEAKKKFLQNYEDLARRDVNRTDLKDPTVAPQQGTTLPSLSGTREKPKGTDQPSDVILDNKGQPPAGYRKAFDAFTKGQRDDGKEPEKK
jgi:hypothetical protein